MVGLLAWMSLSRLHSLIEMVMFVAFIVGQMNLWSIDT